MVSWKNLDTLASYKELLEVNSVNLAEVMTGENGAERVRNYSVPMAEGMAYNYAAKQVDDNILDISYTPDTLQRFTTGNFADLGSWMGFSIPQKDKWVNGFVGPFSFYEYGWKAISIAEKDDAILLAGKGHETYQVIGKERVHYDEREVVAEILK